MAEAWRKDEPLTTADLAGTKTRPSANIPSANIPGANIPGADTPEPARDDFETDPASRPRLIRNELRSAGTGEMVNGSAATIDALPADPNADSRPARDWPTTRGASRETSAAAGSAPLLSDTEVTDLRSRWTDIQAGFVDEPRRSVEQADQLVASAIQRLAEGFARERASLETQWESGSDVSTEDLRLALQRYRSFFGRLLNAA